MIVLGDLDIEELILVLQFPSRSRAEGPGNLFCVSRCSVLLIWFSLAFCHANYSILSIFLIAAPRTVRHTTTNSTIEPDHPISIHRTNIH